MSFYLNDAEWNLLSQLGHRCGSTRQAPWESLCAVAAALKYEVSAAGDVKVSAVCSSAHTRECSLTPTCGVGTSGTKLSPDHAFQHVPIRYVTRSHFCSLSKSQMNVLNVRNARRVAPDATVLALAQPLRSFLKHIEHHVLHHRIDLTYCIALTTLP